MKKFLTIFFYDDIGLQHLYKDVGSIPLGLAKYQNWDSTLAYVNFNGQIHDSYYEKYVHLISISKGINPFYSMIRFLWSHSKEYDVLNLYHFGKKTMLYCIVAKLRNPDICVYVKLDAGRNSLDKYLRRESLSLYNTISNALQKIGLFPDLFTVETYSYVTKLKKLTFDRIRYLPNGIWKSLGESDNIAKINKEKVILNVGRLGSIPKNIPLLIESFAKVPKEVRNGWKLILIGSYDDHIKEVINKVIIQDSSLYESIILTGNIDNKTVLNGYYARAAIYALSSRWESFGIALLEAIHHGDFPIVTDCCDAFEDILNYNSYGRVIPNEDKKLFAEALANAMEDFAGTIKLGQEAKKYVDTHFEYQFITDQLNNYLNTL